MNKKIFIIIPILVLFLYVNTTKALTNNQIIERYSGAIILDTSSITEQYWYIEPNIKERFYLKNGKSISRLIRNHTTNITNEELNKIALNNESVNIDYELTKKLKGKILLDENNEAWYIDILTEYKHKIYNGKKGFDTLKELSINIKKEELNKIPINKSKNFQYKKLNKINLSLYSDVWNTLKNNYYKTNNINEKEMFYGSLEGITNYFNDPYTKFFIPEDKKSFENRMDGSIEGIGAMIEEKNNVLIIVSPLDNSPAEKYGLLPQDQILEVDNINIYGFSLDKSISLIKGKSGTSVHLKIYRPSNNKKFEVDIIREKIIIPSITGEKIDKNIAYFKINLFSLNLKNDFENIKNVIIDKNTKGIILDLRNNPGGYTSSAINLSDYWLNKGNLIFQEKYPNITKKYIAKNEKEIYLPTIILTNNGTASAAEIVTSSLKENNVAQIVGKNTFGKGTGQSLTNFSDGSALKYTIFEWLTPNNNLLEGIGIKPDYIIENDNIDRQLNKAKNLLK